MSEIDDLDAYELRGGNGLELAKQKRGLRRFFAADKRIAGIVRNVALNDGRRTPSLPRFACLDRPITNYLEE